MIEADKIHRFEYLAGRFFDGLLTAGEDEEFVALLEADSAIARHFIEQVRTERAIAGLTASGRLSQRAFNQAVARSIKLLDDDTESARFTDEVVKLVRETSAANSGRFMSVRTRRRIERAQSMPWTLATGIATAAMLTLALLLSLAAPARSPVAEPNVPRMQSLDLAVKGTNSGDRSVPATSASAAQPDDTAEAAAPKVFARIVDPITEVPTAETAEQPAVAAPAPAPVAKSPEPPKRNAEPAEVAVKKSDAQVAVEKTYGALASITKFVNVKLAIVRAGKTEIIAKTGDVLSEGDTLRVLSPDLSAAELPPGPSGADVRLTDGSTLWLKENSVLFFHAEAGGARPLLNHGELLARVQPQASGTSLVIRTKQGPEALVVGTVFRVVADPGNRRVELRVEEGKVQFSNKGEKRMIVADEACVAEDSKIPSAPYLFRPQMATLTGTVTDKETGKPLENAEVAVLPYAERAKSRRPRIGAKTDAQGKFAIRGVYEGPVFVFAKTEEGGAVGLHGRGAILRTRLNAGETASMNITIDKSAIAAGRVYENGGKLVNGYSVRLLPPNSDGQAVTILLNIQKTQVYDYASAALEGMGRYTAVVEKPGFIARIKTPKTYELRPDRITTWPIEVQLAPSAVLKGRIQNAGGVTIADPTGAANDPRAPRTILTLTSSTGGITFLEAEADGTFSFDTNLDSGAYELKAERFGYAPFIKRVNLIAGQTTDQPVTLELPKPAR